MTSRRELYAHGEPFGDSATRAKLGGGYVCGGGGDSSSSSSQSTNYYQTDNRSVTDNRQETTLSNSNNTTTSTSTTTNNITTLDAGAIDAGKSIALAGIANNNTNTSNLLALADKLFSTQQKALDANVTLANSLATGANRAYADATSQATGNKNLVYAGMAVVGIAAVSFFWKKK